MYLSVPALAEYTGSSRSTVERQIREMQDSKHYPPTCYMKKPRRINVNAYVHFCTFFDEINAGRSVPDWRQL